MHLTTDRKTHIRTRCEKVTYPSRNTQDVRAKTFIDFLFNFSELIKERPWAMLVYYAHQASMVFLDI